MEAVQQAAAPQAKPVRKFYVFDRDDTLIDKQSQLISPDFLIPFLQIIHGDDSLQWAIASAGAIEWDADPVKLAIGNQVQKKPFYTQLSHSWLSLLDLIDNVSGAEPQWTQKDNAYIKEQAVNARKIPENLVKAQLIFEMLSQQKDQLMSGVHVSVDKRWLEAEFEFNSGIGFGLNVGNTYLNINAQTFFQHRELIQKGHNKLFCVLLAMDQAKLTLDAESKSKLAGLGIVSINAPNDYQEISAKDVVFVDDRKGNCALLKAAGFTAIQADTQPAFDTKQCDTTNTYMDALNQTLPKDSPFKSLVAEISGFVLKDTPSEIIFEKRNKALEHITALFESNVLDALKALPQLAPLFNYKEFRFFSKSIEPMTATPKLLALADAYIAKNQYHKELSDFLVLNLCHGWKSAETQAKVKQIVAIKSDGQDEISTTHFRLAYQAQYKSEFFCNPGSSIHKQIEANPEEFDKKAMADIKAGISENSRSAKLLGVLGVSR